MDPKYMCNVFGEIDALFNENVVIPNKFDSKISLYKEYCPNRKCDTNRKRISALSRYLFMRLITYSKNTYDEYFLMWLADKLFKIHNKGKGKGNKITLDKAYDKYLKSNIQNFNYWALLYNVRGLKDADLRHMSEFYKLLKRICKTIIEYNKQHDKSTNLIMNSTEASNQYMLLYENIIGCKSYLYLLDNLKKIYVSFRLSVIRGNIRKNPNLLKLLQTFTTFNGEDSYFAIGYNKLDFSDSGCKLQYDDNIVQTLMKAKAQKEKKYNGTKGGDIKLATQLQSSGDQTLNPPSGTRDSPSISDNGTDTLGSRGSIVDDSQKKANIKGSEQKDSEGKNVNQKDSQKDPSDPNIHTPASDPNQGGGLGGSYNEAGSTGSKSRGSDGVPGSTSSESKGSDGGPGNTDSGSGSGTGGGKDSGANGGSSGGGSGVPGSLGDGSGSGLIGGSKTLGDQATTHSSEASNGYLSNLWRTHLNLMNYIPNVPDIYQSSKDILLSATNQVSSAYNSAMTIAQETYDKTVSTVKNVYIVSRNYIGDAVNSVTSQLNSFSISSQLGGNQSGFNSSGSVVDTPNYSQQNPSQTSPPPIPPPSTPQSTQHSPQPLDQQLSQTPSGTSQNSLPSPNVKDQTNVPKLFQDSPQNQSSDQNDQGGSKIPVVKPGNPGDEVKGNGTTGIGDIYVLKEYKQIGISIIVLLIPIALAIMYKVNKNKIMKYTIFKIFL
ncbi:PIR protein CIR protein [Plasmodium vinckei vinckei]|uniref:PIR protein CIR protein n=1 Tax=Plasmodium vinckei vinckei TaxID=54757 RepID=A0A449BPJ2_PLAVN|nr:PIR protein CIR protein [Plasmodium vinckei vinckei]VEV55381.1 PIR protein CIR protein [Plasmodium vinckei vinckei]